MGVFDDFMPQIGISCRFSPIFVPSVFARTEQRGTNIGFFRITRVAYGRNRLRQQVAWCDRTSFVTRSRGRFCLPYARNFQISTTIIEQLRPVTNTKRSDLRDMRGMRDLIGV
jgi:hypothetical protein